VGNTRTSLASGGGFSIKSMSDKTQMPKDSEKIRKIEARALALLKRAEQLRKRAHELIRQTL
jgi:hypothetical protein